MKFTTKIIAKRIINKETLIFRMERGPFKFKAGQYLIVCIPGDKEAREYSIYSGENDPYIEILIKTVPLGSFSTKLGELEIGNELEVDGGLGFFVMKPEEIETQKHLFIATGTGISPFHSYIRTYEKMNYEVYHGIADSTEMVDTNDYPEEALTYCISQEKTNHFRGRVTQYLEQYPLRPGTICHLCGNSAMINDVSDILEDKGIAPENIRTEAFF